MSKFQVTLETIKNVTPLENSDRLDLVKLKDLDYQLVTKRGLYSPGDIVVYFPIDSLLPEWITDALGLTGRLAHGAITDDGSPRKQNRVKTIKLRGAISQGVIATPEVLLEANPTLDISIFSKPDFTEDLGVTKYEPPVIPQKTGNLVAMPDGVSVYDIENAENYGYAIEVMMNTPVLITEKVEGSNWWASLTSDGRVQIGQRNYAIETTNDGLHDWHKVFQQYGMITPMEKAFRALASMGDDLMHRLTVRGEIVGPGIQGNYYNHKNHTVHLFEFERNGVPVDAETFLRLYRDINWNVRTVPIISEHYTLREWLDGRTVKEASNGRSAIANRNREGIVIRPMREMIVPLLGRAIVKQRSPVYLAKEK